MIIYLDFCLFQVLKLIINQVNVKPMKHLNFEQQKGFLNNKNNFLRELILIQ